MKKKLLIILTTLLMVCITSFGLVACSNNGGNDNSETTANSKIVSVYNLYVENAENNGETPMSYEEWLATIKGEKGDKGDSGISPTIEIKDGYWYINDVNIGVKAEGKDGANGKDGQNGQNGKDGIGVNKIYINANGNLIIKLTDNSEIDCGTVVKQHEHVATDWIIDDLATTTEKGLKHKECTTCGAYLDVAFIPVLHSHSYTKEVVTEQYLATPATCLAKATYYFSCVCGEKGSKTFEYGEFGNHNLNNLGACTFCKQIIPITTEEDAIAAVARGGEYTFGDLVLSTALYITKDVTINLAGNISLPTDTVGDGAFCAKAGTLTLNGNGNVNAVGDNDWCMAIWADGGKVVINGGTYTNEGAGNQYHYDLIYVKNGGEVTINGGTFKCSTPEWTLNISNTKGGKIVVAGGSFYKFNPADWKSYSSIVGGQTLNRATETDDITLADGYMVVQDGDWYHVVPVSNEQIIPITTEEDALCAVARGGEYTFGDLVLSSAMYTTKNLVINFSGIVSAPEDETVGDGVFCAKAGTLTLNGTGTVDGKTKSGYNMAVFADGGKIVINGGTYTNEGADPTIQQDLIYVSHNGEIVINGGTFKCATPEWTLNISNTKGGKIVVAGGSFYKFNPAAWKTYTSIFDGYTVSRNYETDDITVADGYMVVRDGDWYHVVPVNA